MCVCCVCVVQGDVDRWFSEICASVDVQKVELVLLSTLCWNTHATTALDFASRYCALICDAAKADDVLREVYRFTFVAAAGTCRLLVVRSGAPCCCARVCSWMFLNICM